MNQLKQRIKNHPVISSILVLLLAILCTEVTKDKGQVWYYSIGAITQFCFAGALIILLKYLDLYKTAGISSPRSWKQVWLIAPLLIYCYINGESFFTGELHINASLGLWSLFIIHYISVGVFEEMVCRSTIMNLMLHKWGNTRMGIYKSVLLSSLIFGLAHLTNLIYGRGDLLSVSCQIIYAIFFGVFFGACMIRNGSVIPAMIMHAFFDICGNFSDLKSKSNFIAIHQTSLEGAILVILMLLPMFLYGLFILRKADLHNTLLHKNDTID
ncbi:CPBP family intramembrane glutamic endopeptidase [Anaeromicropila herbilytica]|uniref:CAAX prenyl protease 2/Lysostaphin resistance protein A-like domain-containing protein n=1 Tax=Anaeromicropila herbilytica TaxID=2785025 RepID=A0A7R7EIE4_9FIRM|nr:CPBP family intramembrane glutamic endopeptidase [Anaeromicropila herbilytica]BCN29310.1 hypothetical protein bsdtb5_06050 [Anaeromicropila herbilytica]